MAVTKDVFTLHRMYDYLLEGGIITNTDGGQLWIWGKNSYGELGQNNTTHRSSPVQVPGTNWYDLFSGTYNSFGIKTDLTLWTWGLNKDGSLGINAVSTSRSSPVQIPGTTWNYVSAATGVYLANVGKCPFSMALATKTDGTLWSWGTNCYGALGVNDRAHRSSPTQIPGITWCSNKNMKMPRSYGFSGLALKTDNTLWIWGDNSVGQFGNNSLVNSSSPVQIPGTTWSYLSVSNQAVAAVKSDNSLWVWGYNRSGQLGVNNTTCYSSPVQVPGLTWCSIAISGEWNQTFSDDDGFFALKTDGTLWAWGNSNAGQLGLNDTVHRSSPTQIPGTTWCRLFVSGPYHMHGMKTDGTVWGLGGAGDFGVLNGTNNLFRSSPVQLPGINWSIITSGAYTTAGLKYPPFV